ncbi:MAG TPA: GNAT family N-acetyltransferase [Arenimonas sp.]|nr:GNAT family N-acetyltransferase [Arenimonas sp.]
MPFPAGRSRPEPPAVLAARGLALRHAVDADLPALMRLYADTRADELAAMPWPEAARQAFLAQQFALQHQHYLSHYGGADFLVVVQGDALVGRYYLWRAEREDLVVDISLLAGWRGQGIGGALLASSQGSAAAQGRGLWLHVLRWNQAAQRLYARLGFEAEEVGSTDTHLLMRWRPPVS